MKSKMKKGDIVGRISYGKDILFIVERVIEKIDGKQIVILKGITTRIEADAPIEDLELIEKNEIEKSLRSLDSQLEEKVKKYENKLTFSFNLLKKSKEKRSIEIAHTGTILHLDGDRKYAEKSAKYYKKVGLKAIIKHIPENKQAQIVTNLLEKYKPDILVITGHDGMIKNNSNYTDIYNYRNSGHFVNSVQQARKWSHNKKDLVIFAGACQSFYEAIISAGANFASSPARILIDFMDPLVVAQKVATTEEYKYIRIEDIAGELRDGVKGVGGIGAKGKKNVIYL